MKEVENKEDKIQNSEVKWTEDQQKAIDTRYCDILVSAAAGSGKTAVLVERIIKIITDTNNPVDIDKLLIVTFTNAAAAEMRERIGEAISKKLEENPNSPNLQKQLTLLNKSNISTLHSFCLNLIRNNFHVINLDPSFRVGDNTEIALLKGEALDEVFEEKYNEENESFHHLIESYCDNKSDKILYELILRLYSFSMSTPSPKKWLLEKAEDFQGKEGFQGFSFKDDFVEEIKEELNLGEKILSRALKLINENSFLEKYRGNIEDDLDIINQCQNLVETSMEELSHCVMGKSFGRLASVKFSNDEEKILGEEVKSYREKAKGIYNSVKEKVLSFTSPNNVEKMRELYPLVLELSNLVIQFKEKFDKKKRERGIVDFNDQEHFALEILKAIDEEGREVPSEVALGLRQKFEEILVDEYQDSNDVQEEIVNLISRKEAGARNRFMVGDLKQSIYRFRMAKPELFKTKKDTYSKEEGRDNRVITLHKNFRSREEVINGINYIFNLIMSEKVGELHYDEEEELKLGASFKPLEGQGVVGGPVELHLISLDDEVENEDKKETDGKDESTHKENEVAGKEEKITDNLSEDEKSEEDLEEEELDAMQIEARAVAERIKELMENRGEETFKVFDKHLKDYRPLEFKDIIILLRSGNKFAPVFVEEFKRLNVPLYAEGGSGYFDTIEVKTIISLLQIIDNPIQDIPLIAVLRSPIGGFSSQELTDIRLVDRKISFYEAMGKYVIKDNIIKDNEALDLEPKNVESKAVEDTSDSNDSRYHDEKVENLKVKIRSFFERLQMWRNRGRYTPINNLIWELSMETGYYGYVGAMPGGTQRQANLRILFQRAKDFERTSYKGLYNFVNFINNLQKTSEDLGAAKIIGENENVVRIMSIHKSKGLEFPVVFLCGMGKQFNQSDLKNKILFHHGLGYGPMYVDLNKRITTTTAQRDYIAKKIQSENKSEEMRLLYVALTRSKEKLILVSSHKKLAKKIETWSEAAGEEETLISQHYVSSQKSYIDWVAPAIMKHVEGEMLRAFNENINIVDLNEDNSKWDIYFHNKSKFSKVVEEAEQEATVEEKLKELESTSNEEEYRKVIEDRLNYKYKYEKSTELPTVITVSKLKNITSVDNNSDYTEKSTNNEELDKAILESGSPDSNDGKLSFIEESCQHNYDNDETFIIEKHLQVSMEKNLSRVKENQQHDLNDIEAIHKEYGLNAIDKEVEFEDIFNIGEEEAYIEERLQDDYNRTYTKALIKTPAFLEEKKGLTPAEVGTALHGVMQRLDLTKVSTVEEVQNQINVMVMKELLTEEQGKAVRAEKVYKFFKSNLGIRVLEAYKNNTLKRELPFRMEISSTFLDNSLPKEIYEDEKIVLRGIIDCYFEEEGEAIILDYKTDYVPHGDVSIVVERYKTQLDFYGEAVEKLLGKKVSEKYLYLFSMDKEVEID